MGPAMASESAHDRQGTYGKNGMQRKILVEALGLLPPRRRDIRESR